MKAKTVSVTLVRRLSDSNYGTYGAEVRVEAELEDGEKASDCLVKLRSLVSRELEVAIEASRIEAKTKAKERSR